MSTVETQIDTNTLESMEFDPTCELDIQGFVSFLRFEVPWGRARSCYAKATWIGSVPCCGETTFACDECHDRFSRRENTFECCGREMPATMITWSRI